MKQLFIALMLVNIGFALLQVLFGADDAQAAATDSGADAALLAHSNVEILTKETQQQEKAVTPVADEAPSSAKVNDQAVVVEQAAAANKEPAVDGDAEPVKLAVAELPAPTPKPVSYTHLTLPTICSV